MRGFRGSPISEMESEASQQRPVRIARSSPGTSSPSGVDLSPCGCGSCVDEVFMTIDRADFGGEWDAACSYYITVGEDVELVYQGGGVWQSGAFGTDSHTFTLTATGQEPGEVILERFTSDPALWGRWKNTVTFWKTHCDATLFLVAAGADDDPDVRPGCSICLKVHTSSACGDCLAGLTLTVDKDDFEGSSNAACSYVIDYDGDDQELLYDADGVWASGAFGSGSNVLRLTVTSPAAGDVTVELLDDMGSPIGSWITTSTWSPSCPTRLVRVDGDGPCSICLSLDEELVEACAGGG